jgi:hypothetical protein
LLVVLIALAGGCWFYLGGGRDDAGDATTTTAAQRRQSCPSASPQPSAVPASEITVNVYNATDRRGLATTVAAQLRRRGFEVHKVANDPAGRTVTGIAEVRSGPGGAAAARTVGAQVGDYVAVPDQRTTTEVDLVVGAGFTRLSSAQEATAQLSPTPVARPSGC